MSGYYENIHKAKELTKKLLKSGETDNKRIAFIVTEIIPVGEKMIYNYIKTLKEVDYTQPIIENGQ